MKNPWMEIPLSDYEAHMEMPSIAQAQMISGLFANLLQDHKPKSVAIIGCSGGNGFECVADANMRVVGVDINQEYIKQAKLRYSKSLPDLELYEGDIQDTKITFAPVELIYAALLFEYVDLETVLQKLAALVLSNGILAVVLAMPSQNIATVSPSPYKSLEKLEAIFRYINPGDFIQKAEAVGLKEIASEILTLPSGKNFSLLKFRRN